MSTEDDFFGISSLGAMPLPQFVHQKPKIVPKSARSSGRTGKRGEDLFEAHFFPELAEKGAAKECEEGDDAQPFIEEQFFPRRVRQQQQQQRMSETGPTSYSADEAEIFELEVAETNGLKHLWALIDPIWKFGKDELVDYMAERVIYESDDIIALDKPFQMACSSGPDDQPQLDRILQQLKQRIAPTTDRLHIVSTLDKNSSGVIIFAKSHAKQLELKAQLAKDAFLFRYRCICKGIPTVGKARINIPLIKVMRGSNLKLCPIVGTASENQQLYHLNTDIKVVNECPKVLCSLLDAFERRGMAHLVRSHLYYGLNCPIVGDKKYVKPHLKEEHPVLETALSPNAMLALSLRKNDIRKMPMFLHCAEVHVPLGTSTAAGGTASANSSVNRAFHTVRAEVPPFFAYALKKLHLLRK